MFSDHLEYYSTIAVRSINHAKTQVMWFVQAVAYPNLMLTLKCGGHEIECTKSYNYLSYLVTTKLDWEHVINPIQIKIRQQIVIVNSIRFSGATSTILHRALFATFLLPFFTWLYALYPLFTNPQRIILIISITNH